MAESVLDPAEDLEDRDPEDIDQPIPDIKTRPGIYVLILGLVFGLYAFFLFYATFLWDVILLDIGLKFNLGMFFLIPIGFHVYFSFKGKSVETNEIAGYYFYGLPLKKAGPGPKFCPAGFMQIIKYDGDQQQIYAPGKPETIFWGDEKENLPAGMVRPIFIPTRPPEEPEKAPLDAQMSVGAVYYLLWRVTNVFNFHARVKTIPEGDSLLRSVSRRALRELIVKYTAGQAIIEQETINGRFDDRVRRRARNLGIGIDDGGIEDLNTTHELGSAMRDRASARFKAETQNIKTDADAYEREKLGKAQAAVDQALEAAPLLGRAEGIAAMARVVKEDPNALGILAGENAREMMERAHVVYAGGAEGSLRDIMAATSAVAEGMKPRPTKGVKDGSTS